MNPVERDHDFGFGVEMVLRCFDPGIRCHNVPVEKGRFRDL